MIRVIDYHNELEMIYFRFTLFLLSVGPVGLFNLLAVPNWAIRPLGNTQLLSSFSSPNIYVLPGLTKTWAWTWTSRMLNGGLRSVDLLILGGWKPWTWVPKQWTIKWTLKI